MHVYIFTANSFNDIEIGLKHKTWAVELMEEPHAWARMGRARQVPLGAAGLFYCSATPGVFTSPFIVESRPEEGVVARGWGDPRFLPFSIRPIGDLSHQILFSHARLSWPTLKGVEDPATLLNLAPELAFTPSFIPRYDWDLILEQLQIDPEAYEELWSAVPTKA